MGTTLLVEGGTEVATGIVGGITAVWTEVADWIVTTLPNVVKVFYADGKLTFLGTLSVVALGVSVFFLIMGLIQKFLHLRG